ncbi:WD repeat protein [Spraguea lophii 42_110]|uniref:WD repeat protein n=1 Tax=Spraguea lophii (strain 42_110) TaxID=1358809 RepID=S7W948_SPRLO|nr:WD repeat protein [Spraguea lophii 42_110]
MKKRTKLNNIDITVTSLPNELISRTLSHLNLYSLKCLSKNKYCNNFIANSNLLWKQKYKNLNDKSLFEIKEEVKNKYLMHKIWLKGEEKRVTLNCEQTDITQLKIHNGLIITSSDDRTIKIFPTKNDTVKTFTGHTAGVWCFDVYDKYLVSGSIDKTVRIWNLESGNLEVILTGHLSTVRSIKVYKNYVASGSRDATIKIWKNGELIHTLKRHSLSVRTLDMNEKYLLSGSYDGTVTLWNYRTGIVIKNLQTHLSRVYIVLLGKRFIVSGSQDGTINVSNYDGKLLYSLKGHRRIVTILKFETRKFYDEERYLISSGEDGVVNKWDLFTGEMEFTIKETGYISAMDIGNGIIFVGLANQVKAYKLRNGKFIKNVLSNVTLLSGIECSEDKLIIAYKKGVHTKLDVISFV